MLSTDKFFKKVSLKIFPIPSIVIFFILGLTTDLSFSLLSIIVFSLFLKLLKHPYSFFISIFGFIFILLGSLFSSRIVYTFLNKEIWGKEPLFSQPTSWKVKALSDSSFTNAGYRRVEVVILKSPQDLGVQKSIVLIGRFLPIFSQEIITIKKRKIKMLYKYPQNQFSLWINSPSEIEIRENYISHFRRQIFNKLEQFWKFLSPRSSDWLRALLTGERFYLIEEEKELFKKTGLSHLLALSGFHLAFWALSIHYWLKRVLSRRTCELVMPFILLIYLVSIGFYPSLVRAWIFFLICFFYRFFYLKFEPWTIVSLTCLLSLFFDPMLLKSLAFWLSWLAFTAILITSGEVFVKTSLMIYFLTSPVIILFFGEVPLIGFILTPLASYLISIFMMIGILCGITGILGIVFLNNFLSALTESLIDILEFFLKKGSLYTFPVGWRGFLITLIFSTILKTLQRTGIFSSISYKKRERRNLNEK